MQTPAPIAPDEEYAATHTEVTERLALPDTAASESLIGREMALATRAVILARYLYAEGKVPDLDGGCLCVQCALCRAVDALNLLR